MTFRQDCPHRNVRIVWTAYTNYGATLGNGRQLRQYCDDCGRLFGTSLKRSVATPDTPEITRDEAMRYSRELQDQLAQSSYERELQDERWRADYLAYLESDAWAAKRKLVLARARGICEGCGQAPAEQAHHLTYKNVCREFLFELVAICRDCHERYHRVTETN